MGLLLLSLCLFDCFYGTIFTKKVFSALCIFELVATNSNMIFDVSACFVFATFLFCATRMVLWFMTQQIGEFRIILVISLRAFRLSRISSRFQLIFIATLAQCTGAIFNLEQKLQSQNCLSWLLWCNTSLIWAKNTSVDRIPSKKDFFYVT